MSSDRSGESSIWRNLPHLARSLPIFSLTSCFCCVSAVNIVPRCFSRNTLSSGTWQQWITGLEACWSTILHSVATSSARVPTKFWVFLVCALLICELQPPSLMSRGGHTRRTWTSSLEHKRHLRSRSLWSVLGGRCPLDRRCHALSHSLSTWLARYCLATVGPRCPAMLPTSNSSLHSQRSAWIFVPRLVTN